MRQTLLVFAVLVVFLTAGCSSQNTGKLEGKTWSSLPTMIKGKALPAGALVLEFTAEASASADGKVSYTIDDTKYEGKYSLTRGNTVVFRFDKEIAGRKVHTEQIVVDGNRLTMTDTDGTKIHFQGK
jgi:hypothetical protein